MARIFAIVAAFYVGGAFLASLVAQDVWLLIIIFFVLLVLSRVFNSMEK